MAGDTSPARLAPARPSVAVAGRDSPSLAEGLLGLRIHEDAQGLYTCEASFGNWGTKGNRVTFLYFDRHTFDFGRELRIGLAGEPLFTGRITGLEAQFAEHGFPSLTVLAEDRHQDLRMTRRTRTFTEVSDADVIQRVAGDHGLRADVAVTGPTYQVLAQLNQSDLAFLRERARAVDAELWMNGSTLLARSRADRGGTPLRLGLGNELRSFTVIADLADQRSGVTVSGWDVAGKAAMAERAEEAALGRELRDGQGGSSVLTGSLGQRQETVVHAVPFTSSEARTRAETLYRRMARRFVHGHGVAQANPRLRVGSTVRLEHLGELFSGEYYVCEVTHLFDGEEGLRTELAVERAWLGRPTG